MIALLAGLAAAGAAAGPGLPGYEPGDGFIFDDGRVERVRTVDGDRVTWSGLNDIRYERSPNPVAPILAWRFAKGRGARIVGKGADALWPLHAGGNVRFGVVTDLDTNGERRRSTALWSCAVGRPRPVGVPAGNFVAWPIRCERYVPATMRLAERVEWWWSDEVGHYVRRRITTYFNGEIREINLVAALSGPRANPQRLAAIRRDFLASRSTAVGRTGR